MKAKLFLSNINLNITYYPVTDAAPAEVYAFCEITTSNYDAIKNIVSSSSQFPSTHKLHFKFDDFIKNLSYNPPITFNTTKPLLQLFESNDLLKAITVNHNDNKILNHSFNSTINQNKKFISTLFALHFLTVYGIDTLD